VWPRVWGRGIALYTSMTAALEGGEWSAARPGRTLPPGKNRYPFYRKLIIALLNNRRVKAGFF
jgi:hypothetical protein